MSRSPEKEAREGLLVDYVLGQLDRDEARALDNYRVRQELRLQRTVTAMLQQPNIVLSFALHGTGTGSGALGKVALDLDSGKGAVAIERLPALPAGQVYRLWALVGEKNVPCGDFGVNSEGRVVTQFPIPVDSYTAPIAKLFLTVEPTAAPPEPRRTDGNDELNRPETMSRVGKIGSERVTSVDRAKAVPRPAKAGAATLRPRAATTRRARMRRLTVNRAHARKVCRAGFCRPRHGVRLIQRAARSPSVPDPRQGLGSL